MKRASAVLALAVASAWAQAAVTQTTRYVFISENNGKQMGEQVVENHDDGLTRVRYIFKDNGRGPELTEEFRLAADGTMAEYHVKGNSTFGAVVDEHFQRSGGKAQWRSTSEQGAREVSGPAVYVPLNSSFETDSRAIAALAKTPSASIALLPNGTLKQAVLDEVQVSGPNGQTQQVQLVAQTGLGLSPKFLWISKGANPALFAAVAPGTFVFAVEGWQDNGKLLAERQKAAEAKLLNDMAARLQHPLPGLTVVKNARIFDSNQAVVGAPSDIYLLRGRISAIVPAGTEVRGAANEIDAGGRIVLPGLFDMHGHITRWEGALHVAAGVTSLRDMGNDNAQLQMMIDETAGGKLLAPQIVPAGFLEGDSPYASISGFLVKTLEQSRRAIDWYAEHGYPQLKIYNSFPKEILKDTVAYAHLRGMRVSGHIPAGLRAQQALDAGYDEIQHINQVMLNFLFKPGVETRSLERFYLPAEKVAELDFHSKPVQDFVATLKKKQIVIDPTLSAFAFLKQKDGEINEPWAALEGNMPPDVARGFHVGTMKIPDAATQARYDKSYAKMVQFVGILYRAGVPIVAGTDDLAGFTLHSELALLVKAGLTPAQAIQVATRNGARYTRTSFERGSIEPGKLADLVLVEGDPTRNIEDVRKVAAVITRGQIVYPKEVDEALGIKPFVADAPAVKALAPVPSNIAGSNDAVLRQVGAIGRKHD
ncbi:amidohydrolase family protein [Pseudoduganella violaceinigra]|uniref:amidohydrolase family protein n=1 Tax=Pseudoduganella violaceinigra TaxID=246602 RepID=UPI00042A166B|nr:amidohydrolase family protein [Pseudoduganella violaceinigra]